MRFDKLFPSKYLKAADLDGPTVFTIKTVTLEELEGDKGPEVKPLVYFTDSPKIWVLNRTNSLCLKEMFGGETNDWENKRVTLFPAVIEWGESGTALRVMGSPDLVTNLTFALKLPRKRPFQVTLKATP